MVSVVAKKNKRIKYVTGFGDTLSIQPPLPPDSVEIPHVSLAESTDVGVAGSTNIPAKHAVFGTPSFEALETRNIHALRDAGVGENTIRAISTPGGEYNFMGPIDWGEIVETIGPVLDTNPVALHETAKIAKQLHDDGIPISPFEWSSLRQLMLAYGTETIDGLGEANGWWRQVRRKAAGAGVGIAEEAIVDFSIGLGLFDFAEWTNKRLKMMAIPRHKWPQIEQMILPTITLGTPEGGTRDFSIGTSASLWLIGQRLYGIGERVSGSLTRFAGEQFNKPPGLSKLLPGDLLEDLGNRSWDRGERRQRNVRGVAPPLVAALGPRLKFTDVWEHSLSSPEDFDNWHEAMLDRGLWGQLRMAQIAFSDAGAEFFDPQFWLAGGIQKIRPALQAFHARKAPERAAVEVANLARRSFRWDDAIDASRLTARVLNSMEREMKATTKATGSVPDDMYQVYIAKRREHANNLSWLDNFKDAGPHEAVLLRTSRRNPEMVPDMTTTEEYVVGLRPGKKGPVASAVKTERIQNLESEIHDLKELARANRRSGVPGLVGATQKRINQAKMRKAETELAKLKQDPEFVLQEPVFGEHDVGRPMHEITKEMHDLRKKELARGFDDNISGAWNDPDDFPLFQQRQVLGPDPPEQSADVLNLMARTGGTSIDDVAITPFNVEYGALPQSKIGLLDERTYELARAAYKGEREFESVFHGGVNQLDFFERGMSTLQRQETMIKRNLGMWRANSKRAFGETGKRALRTKANAPVQASHIEYWQRMLANNRKAQNAMLKEKPTGFSMRDAYEDKWLPPPQETIMSTPERFNRWLDIAGDVAVRSLYPGALTINTTGDMRMRDLFAWAREPLRYYESYDPKTGEELRNGYLRYHQWYRSWYDEIQRAGMDSGLVKKRSKFNPKKHWDEFVIDPKQDRQLFDLLDTVEGTSDFEVLARDASPELMKVHGIIRKKLNHAADLQGISGTDKYLTGYIRHVFTKDQFSKGATPLEYIGLPRSAEAFIAHMLDRTGAEGFQRSAMAALDIYGRAVPRKLILEPTWQSVLDKGVELSKSPGLGTFHITYANDLVSHLKGQPIMVGKKIDDFLGGVAKAAGASYQPAAVDRALIGISGLIWAGALAGSPRYGVMQIATGTATTAGRYGLWRTAKGLFEMATPEGQATARALGTYDQFQSIFESSRFRKISNMMTKVPGITPLGPIGPSVAFTENYARGASALAAIDYYMTKAGLSSWQEALDSGVARRIAFQGLRSAEETNHMYGAMGRSATLTRFVGPGAAVSGTQFLSFIPKQTEELLAQFARNPGNIAMYLAVSGFASRIAASQMGVNITNYVGFGWVPGFGDFDDVTAPAVDIFMGLVNYMSAHNSRDPQEIQRTGEKLLDDMKILAPMANAFMSAAKNLERLSKQEQISGRGEKIRDLDFKGLGIGESLRPSETTTDPSAFKIQHGALGLGGDFIPSLLGQQSIRDEQTRRFQRSTQLEKKRFQHNLRNLVEDVFVAQEKGDTQRVGELFQELEDTYKIRMSSTDPITRQMELHHFSYMLRLFQRDKKFRDRYLELMEGYGVGFE